MPTQPNLGYGNASEATIDQVNQWMRSTPWYQALLKSWGQDPNNVHLSDAQKQQVIKAAQANGVVVDEGKQEIDDSGNFRNQGHKLRNTLIVAGLAAATIATMGAAGAFSGAAAGAMGAGEGAAAAGTTAGTLAGIEGGAYGIGAGTVGALGTGAMGATALPALGAVGAAGATGATLAGVEGGAYGLGDSALAGMGTGAMGTVPVGAGAGATGAFDAAGNFIGDTTYSTSDGSSMLSRVGRMANQARGIGDAIGSATTAAGQNRLDQEHAALTANGQNIQGQSAFENEMLNRALLEDRQRKEARLDLVRDNFFKNQPHSPYNPVATPALTPEYAAAMDSLAKTGSATLQKPAIYDARGLPALTPYKPLNVQDVQGSTGTKKGTLETIGDWAGPGLTTAGAIMRMFG